MNTYNDNLRSSVINSLNEQDIDQKKLGALLNAATIKLYHAQGARVDAAEDLELANRKIAEKTKVKKQAVKNSTKSSNLLLSAKQAKKYVDLSVTNSAVAAANVQAATKAIVKLASDIGSINSIALAADFDSDIGQHYEGLYKLMNTTAYNAELASKDAMEAAELTAKISADTVATSATATNEKVDSLLKVASTEFEKVYETVTADHQALAQADTLEKSAEGALKDVNVEAIATQKAYLDTNEELNLGLQVISGAANYTRELQLFQSTSADLTHIVEKLWYDAFKDKDKSGIVKELNRLENRLHEVQDVEGILWLIRTGRDLIDPNNQQMMNLNPLKDFLSNLYGSEGLKKLIQEATTVTNTSSDVTDFGAILTLPDAKKAAILLGIAVVLIKLKIPQLKTSIQESDSNYRVEFNALLSPFPKDPHKTIVKNYYIFLVKEAKKLTFNIAQAEQFVTNNDTQRYVVVDPADTPFSASTRYCPEINIYELNDTDNDVMQLGKKYVVFVMAVLEGPYKRALNNYEDYLTAGSQTFSLTSTLIAPDPAQFRYVDTYQTITKETSDTNDIVYTPYTKSAIETLMQDHDVNKKFLKGITFKFSIDQEDNKHLNPIDPNPIDPGFRCMFIPANDQLVSGLLTANELPTYESETQRVEQINKSYKAKIENTQEHLLFLENLGSVNSDLLRLMELIKKSFEKDKKIIDQRVSEILDNLKETDKNPVLVAILEVAQELLDHGSTIDKAVFKKKLKSLSELGNEEHASLIVELIKLVRKLLNKTPEEIERELSSLKVEFKGFKEILQSVLLSDSQVGIELALEFIIQLALYFIGIVNQSKGPILVLQAQLKKLISQKNEAISKINLIDNSEPGIFFNLLLANQVTAGNYTPAVPSKDPSIPENKNNWDVHIKDDTTDNFGNPLIKDNHYIPVILAYSKRAVDTPHNYTNALSDYANTHLRIRYKAIPPTQ